jgi:hypothetical protein
MRQLLQECRMCFSLTRSCSNVANAAKESTQTEFSHALSTPGDWLAALRASKPAKVVAVALVNKLARIVWAIITTGEAFRSSIYAKA